MGNHRNKCINDIIETSATMTVKNQLFRFLFFFASSGQWFWNCSPFHIIFILGFTFFIWQISAKHVMGGRFFFWKGTFLFEWLKPKSVRCSAFCVDDFWQYSIVSKSFQIGSSVQHTADVSSFGQPCDMRLFGLHVLANY